MSIYSRNTISLNTVGNGENDQYYDQICGLSQKTINENFKALFAQRGVDVAELVYNTGFWEDGILEAIMDAPTVILSMDGGADPLIFFQIRIKTGRISFSSSDPRSMQKLDGWVICVSATLDHTCISPNAFNSPEDAAEAAAALQEASKTFDFREPTKMKAGDYSIHRLFASISENQWSKPVPKYSKARNEANQEIPLNDWYENTEKGRSLGTRIMGCLQRWATDRQSTSAFFTLGLQLRLPKASEQPLELEYAPTSLRLQNYPFLTDDEQVQQRNEAMVGTSGNDYNCFLFCETVKNRQLPKTRYLPYTGNLAEPAKGSDPDSEIFGTFVLSHQMYLEGQVLPLLQELCLISHVIPLKPDMYVDGDKVPIFRMKVCVGVNPQNSEDYPGLPNQIATDRSFAFTWKRPREYLWESHLSAPGSDTDLKSYQGSKKWPFYRKWTTKSDAAVGVDWKSGGHQINVSGKIRVYHWEGYSSRDSFGWGGNDDCYWGTFTITSSWSFIIDLLPTKTQDDPKVPNGVIEPKLLNLDKDNLPKNFKIEVVSKYFLDQTPYLVTDQIRKYFIDSLKRVNTNLKSSAAGFGKFLYPGSGELAFGPPIIGDHGDILASIKYLPLKEGRVAVIPPQPKQMLQATQRRPGDIVANPIVPRNPPRILWKPYFKNYNPTTGRLQLNLKGENRTDVAIAFDAVRVTPLKSNIGDKIALYNADDFSWEKFKPQTANPPAAQPPAAQPPASHPRLPPASPVSPFNDGKLPSDTPAPGADGDKSRAIVEDDWLVVLGTEGSTNKPKTNKSTVTTVEKASQPKNAKKTPSSMAGDKKPSTVTKDTKIASDPSGGKQPLSQGEDPTSTPATGNNKPKHIYNLNSDGVSPELLVRVTSDASTPVFTIYSEMNKLKGKTRTRFILQPGSFLELELDGKTEEPGKYILALDEIWNSTDANVNLGGKETAASYLKVQLKAEDSSVEMTLVTLEAANELRGVRTETK